MGQEDRAQKHPDRKQTAGTGAQKMQAEMQGVLLVREALLDHSFVSESQANEAGS